jgi:hypothetical protein
MDYVPTKEADFSEWGENLIHVSTAHKTEWNLPQDKLTELTTLHGEVEAALYDLCQTAAYTKTDIRMKKEKKKRLRHLEWVFVWSACGL